MASRGAKQMGRIMCKRSQKRWSIPSLSSILHQNNRPNTSNLWLLTFFPFLFHTIFGRGSPVAWQMKEATPPCTPVWSLGVLKNFGGAVENRENRRRRHKTVSEHATPTIISHIRPEHWEVAHFSTWSLRGLTFKPDLQLQTIDRNDFYWGK